MGFKVYLSTTTRFNTGHVLAIDTLTDLRKRMESPFQLIHDPSFTQLTHHHHARGMISLPTKVEEILSG